MNTPEPPGDEAARPLTRHLRLVGGREIPFDAEGFLWDFDDWSEEVAAELATESGIEHMEEVHWRIIRFLREYYAYHGRAPLNQQIRKGTGMSLLDMQRLFPGGLTNGARRLAGLPNPKTCN